MNRKWCITVRYNDKTHCFFGYNVATGQELWESEFTINTVVHDDFVSAAWEMIQLYKNDNYADSAFLESLAIVLVDAVKPVENKE